MIKIAFFDIDGTPLRFRHNDLSEPVRSALKQLQKQGILLCMATGRSYPFIPRFEGIEFDVILSFNGSYVRNREEVIRKELLTREDVNCIIGNLNKKKRAIAISNEAVVVTNGTDPDLEQYFAFGNEEMIISEKFNDISREDIYQIMCSCTKDEYEEILEGTKHAQITSWWDRAADIIPSNSGKGIAVMDVLDYYGISREESIAFGDGKNDIEMLRAVGIGVAMGNSCTEVKESADESCLSVEEDGIYHYFLERNMIEAI